MANLTKEFFEQHPDAPGVWKVDSQLFLQSRKGNAIQHAKRFGLELEWVDNPKVKKAEEKTSAKSSTRKASSKKSGDSK